MRGRKPRVPFHDPISEISNAFGIKPTSGYRTKAHQAALRAQGLTDTINGSHQRRDGVDWPTPPGMTKQQFIAALKQRYPAARIIPSNGNAVHMTLPGYGMVPDVSGSERRYPDG